VKKNMKQEEIARLLGLSKETVKKHMALALKSIRGYILEHIHTRMLVLFLIYNSQNFHHSLTMIN